MKHCTKCKQTKEISEFYVTKRDGVIGICKECRRAASRINSKIYYSNNREQIIVKTGIYSRTHKDTMRPWHASYAKTRRQEDLEFRLAHNLRKRISNRIASSKTQKKYKKTQSAIKELGCTVDFLISHLESLWTTGMNWSNYGNKKDQWCVDHKIPLDSFDLSDTTQFSKANHYLNLQPMWVVDNLKKGTKLDYKVPTSDLQLK
jgi:hypothetical protein